MELGLVPVTEPRGERANRITYSIQHPDLSSALTPPDAASVAVFRSVLYSIDLLTRQRRGNRTELCNEVISTRRAYVNDENKEYNDLSPADRKAVDDFMGRMKTNFESNASSNVPEKRRRVDTVTDAPFSPHVNTLLSTWLESVFMGQSRRYSKTVTFTESISAAPLSRLAPGVFDVPYLRVVTF